jgi:hypothetical protein
MAQKVKSLERSWTYRQITRSMLNTAIWYEREKRRSQMFSGTKWRNHISKFEKDFWTARAQGVFYVWRELCDGLLSKRDYLSFRAVVGLGGRELERFDIYYFRPEDRESMT